jgi:hypothetical protein
MSFGSWQDLVIAVVQWVFAVSLVPTILHATEKPTFVTAIVTSVSLFVMTLAFASLHLWFSAASVAVGGIAWSILTWQRFWINKKSRKPLVEWPKWK